jgi:hypothetical protein
MQHSRGTETCLQQFNLRILNLGAQSLKVGREDGYRKQLKGFEVLSAVVMSAAILWDIAPFSQYTNRRFGGTYHFHLHGRKSTKQGTSTLECSYPG